MKGTFNSHPCATTDCSRPARSSFGRYCEQCRKRARVHGHPQQVPVRKPEVRKHIQCVRRLLRRGNLEKIETHLRAVAVRLDDAARSPEAVAVYNRNGKTTTWVHIWKQKAVDEILRVLGDTSPVESGILVAALFLMRDQEKRRFVEDEAFNFTLVRLWRAQTRLAFGSYWNPKTDRVTAHYRDLPPRVIEEIEPFLTTAYSRFAGYVLSAFHKDHAQQAALRTSLDEGFAPLQ